MFIEHGFDELWPLSDDRQVQELPAKLGASISGGLAGLDFPQYIQGYRVYPRDARQGAWHSFRSEEHTSELQSLMRNSYAVFCLKKKNKHNTYTRTRSTSQTTTP